MAIAFGKYALQRKLAEGGMAEVFLGKQAGMEGFEKLVVLKRIRPELSSDKTFVDMFLNEARVAARLNHPNIVQIFELGKVERQYFIAMEFIHGEDLRALTRQADRDKKHPTAGLICRVVADTLAGLHYAHTRSSPDGKPLGLVHRDVSPQNVLVTYEGGVKLVDFGIAKATRGGLTEQTRAGLFKGKFAYMSPEQSRGQPLDARSDIFAVGILLWELLTWTRLFKRGSDMATLIAVAEEEIPSPRSFDTTIPPELERIVMKSLQRKTHMRYTTALEMRADLEALIRGQAWHADSLALQTYMHDLFGDKLRRQEDDIRESGFGSLEDFLLTVDEKSSVSWMKAVGVKTPSSGLPQSSPKLPGVTNAKLAYAHTTELDAPPDETSDGLAVGAGEDEDGELPELPGESTTFSAMPVFDDQHSGTSDTAAHAAVPLATADTAPVAEIPRLPPLANLPAPRPAPKPALFSTAKPVAQPAAPAELPSLPTAIVSAPSDLPSLPTAIVAPRHHAPPQTESPTLRGSSAAHELLSQSTVIAAPQQPQQQPSYDAARAAAYGLDQPTVHAVESHGIPTTAEEMSAISTTSPRPAFDPPAKRRWPLAAAALLLAGGIGTAAALWPGAQGPPIATLDITLDKPAIISVDGKAEPVAQRATVRVRPGVTHVVTVEYGGKVLRTLNVPGMAPNEQLQLNVIVK